MFSFPSFIHCLSAPGYQLLVRFLFPTSLSPVLYPALPPPLLCSHHCFEHPSIHPSTDPINLTVRQHGVSILALEHVCFSPNSDPLSSSILRFCIPLACCFSDCSYTITERKPRSREHRERRGQEWDSSEESARSESTHVPSCVRARARTRTREEFACTWSCPPNAPLCTLLLRRPLLPILTQGALYYAAHT